MDSASLLAIISDLHRFDYSVYLTGGAVRDRFLHREPHDLDFTAEGDIRPLATALADRLRAGFFPLDEERGTYRVVLEGGRTTVDFAALRGQDLHTDLTGRDFTINAMALDIKRMDCLIDPLGGLQDLKSRSLRSCSPSSMTDDPARVLRAVRLKVGLGLEIEPQTFEWVKQGVPLLDRISPERVRDELLRMLETPGSAECLRIMDSLRVISEILPDLTPLKGVHQSPPHVYPVWEHTLEALNGLDILWDLLVEPEGVNVSENKILDTAFTHLGQYRERLASHFSSRIIISRSLRSLLAFALLYHDNAKPHTQTVDPDGKTRFLGHDDQGARVAVSRARALSLSGDETARVHTIVAEHMRIHQLSQSGELPSPRAIYRFFRDTGPAGIDLCLLSLADTLATYGHTISIGQWERELAVCKALMEARWDKTEEIVSPPRLIDGNELMRLTGLGPGPSVGKLLEALREAQVDGEVNSHEDAVEFVRRVAQDLV